MPGKKAANYIVVGMWHIRFQKTFRSFVMRKSCFLILSSEVSFSSTGFMADMLRRCLVF